jgi:pimeloyl-ACP methyl ester carboxylesterase
MARSRALKRLLKALALIPLVGTLVTGALALYLWLEHHSELTLPLPTGPFPVGRVIQDWADTSALSTLAPGANRELLVWIWYPAAATDTLAADAYIPLSLRPRAKPAAGPNVWSLLTRDPSKVRGHSVRAPAVSALEPSYPLVILRAAASAPVVNYSSLAEDLASHGYVVVGFDAPYRTWTVVFPDGRMMHRTDPNNPELCVVPERAQMERCVGPLLTAWTSDIAFVLDRLLHLNSSDSAGRFVGRLDLTHVGVIGHSFGGAVAAQFCHEDSRCTAGVDIDGALHGSVVLAGLRQPFMFLLSDQGTASDWESRQFRSDIDSVYGRMSPHNRLRVIIRGAFHFTFSDDGALLKSGLIRAGLRLFGKLGVDGRRQLALTAYSVRTFLDAYLRGRGSAQPMILSPLYPELTVQ